MKIELINREEFDRRTRYWIRTITQECPLCGKGDTFRERVLYSKEDRPENTFEFEYYYDYCDAF